MALDHRRNPFKYSEADAGRLVMSLRGDTKIMFMTLVAALQFTGFILLFEKFMVSYVTKSKSNHNCKINFCLTVIFFSRGN